MRATACGSSPNSIRSIRSIHAEPFDKFYFWGDMLLTDFDTIDKYRIDAADAVPQHLGDQGDRGRHLVPHSRAAANPVASGRRWATRPTFRRRNASFLAIWKTLGPVYRRFRERLAVAGHRLQRHGPAGRRRPHRARGAYAFPEAADGMSWRDSTPCRSAKSSSSDSLLDCRRDRFLLGLRLLL